MSKEKLQDIKDKYAKVNYDNGESHATSWQELLDNDLSFDNEDIDALMKLAYNQALEDANNKCGSTLISVNPNKTIGQSILKLKV